MEQIRCCLITYSQWVEPGWATTGPRIGPNEAWKKNDPDVHTYGYTPIVRDYKATDLLLVTTQQPICRT